MVRVEEIPDEAERPERPWFRIGEATAAQEEAIRQHAYEEGFMTLRGYWRHMQAEGWDYYDIIRMESPQA